MVSYRFYFALTGEFVIYSIHCLYALACIACNPAALPSPRSQIMWMYLIVKKVVAGLKGSAENKSIADSKVTVNGTNGMHKED